MAYRIGIDARIFGAKRGGIGRYTEELARALPANNKKDTFVLFMRKEDMRFYKPRSLRVKKVCADIREYSKAEQVLMPGIIREANIDLLHVPHINVPYAYNGPLIVTVHDLIEYKYDRSHATTLPKFLYKGKRAILRRVLPKTLNRAEALIAVSNWGKRDIQATFPSVKTPVYVISHGAPKLPKRNARSPVSFPYILYIGSAAPHKNTTRLAYAFRDSITKGLIREHAVFVMPDDAHSAKFSAVIRRFPRKVQERIHFTSSLSDEDLAAYIIHASLLCSASLEEGYGLPFAEALKAGTPVLGSFVGILPEIGGVYVHYWDPQHITSMSKSLVYALHNPKRPPRPPAIPSWRTVAGRHIALYTYLLKKAA